MKHYKMISGFISPSVKSYKFRRKRKSRAPVKGKKRPPEKCLHVDEEYFQELLDIYKKAVWNFESPLSTEKYYQCLGAMKLLDFLLSVNGKTLSGARWVFSRKFRIGKKYDIRGNCVGEY